jgi:hypothetical protein
VRLSFYRETSSAYHPSAGRLVELQPGRPPRLMAELTLPCPDPVLPVFGTQDDVERRAATAIQACTPAVQMRFWLDRRANVTLWFRGDGQVHHATLGSTTYTLAAHGLTAVAGDIARGDSEFTLRLGWHTTAGPRLVKAQIRTGGVTRSLLY